MKKIIIITSLILVGCEQAFFGCNYDEPNKQYVEKDPAICSVIKYTCLEGENYFSDDCGCGCEEKKVSN